MLCIFFFYGVNILHLVEETFAKIMNMLTYFSPLKVLLFYLLHLEL